MVCPSGGASELLASAARYRGLFVRPSECLCACLTPSLGTRLFRRLPTLVEVSVFLLFILEVPYRF